MRRKTHHDFFHFIIETRIDITKKVERLGKMYDISLEVKVKENGDDGYDGIGVGLDKHLAKDRESEESILSHEEIGGNYKSQKEILSEITMQKDTKGHSDS